MNDKTKMAIILTFYSITLSYLLVLISRVQIILFGRFFIFSLMLPKCKLFDSKDINYLVHH